MVRKSILLCVILVFWGKQVSAQNAKLFDLGLKTSANLQVLNSNSDALNNLTISGGNLGIFATVNFPIVGIGVQVEALVNQNNLKLTEQAFNSLDARATANDQELNFKANQTLRLFTLTVPVLFHYNLLKLFALELGPQFNFALNNNAYKIGDDPFANSLSVQGLAGVRLSISKFSFYLRYVHDITNVNASNISNVIGDIKNGQIRIGVGFSLVKK